MILNKYGEIVKKCWLEIPKHFLYCQLDEFVIMPNHIHAVLIIEGYDDSVEKSIFPDNPNIVVNANLHSLQYDRTKMYLSKIVQGFKSSVTRILRREYNDYCFSWQKSFYDHVIRNEKALNNIRQYIIDNPMNWNKDEENNLHSENM